MHMLIRKRKARSIVLNEEYLSLIVVMFHAALHCGVRPPDVLFDRRVPCSSLDSGRSLLDDLAMRMLSRVDSLIPVLSQASRQRGVQ